MGKKIIWSSKASYQFNNIFDFYFNKAGLKIAEKISAKIIEDIEKLVIYPHLGKLDSCIINSSIAYRFLISNNYKIIYVDGDDEIYITAIFDTRQNPIKIKT